MDEQLLEMQTREQDINKLAKGVQEVSDLFTDVSLLVTYQGNQIDNIENNVSQTLCNIDRANKQLEKAKTYRDKKRKCYLKIGIFFTIFGFIFVLIIINNN
jgi:syntaxin 16